MAYAQYAEWSAVTVVLYMLSISEDNIFMNSSVNTCVKTFIVAAREIRPHLSLLLFTNALGSIPNTPLLPHKHP